MDRQGPLAFLSELLHILKAFVRGQVVISLWMMVLYAAGFAFLKVLGWPLVAVACGSLHLVPMLGAVLGLLIPVGIVLLTGGGAHQAIGVVGVFVFAQAFESFYLTPKILGTRLRMRPLIVFVALVTGAALFGFFGALLAVPAVAAAMFIWRALYRKPRRGFPA